MSRYVNNETIKDIDNCSNNLCQKAIVTLIVRRMVNYDAKKELPTDINLQRNLIKGKGELEAARNIMNSLQMVRVFIDVQRGLM
ncbi:hypothetical protein QE152_g19594 [Popillia japonica]|uniref:Uncharacterized protein n=1 Tax=Popillia japonica TaxID=7064 RepID=A0AAW1KR42_POPJA